MNAILENAEIHNDIQAQNGNKDNSRREELEREYAKIAVFILVAAVLPNGAKKKKNKIKTFSGRERGLPIKGVHLAKELVGFGKQSRSNAMNKHVTKVGPSL